MPRDIDDLQEHALNFWPESIAQQEREASIIPRLLETQEKFIGMLYVADATPDAWIDILGSTKGMPGNLFLKHLVVLADVGGEKLMRLKRALPNLLRKDRMHFVWDSHTAFYDFQTLSNRRVWSNSYLRIDGRSLRTAEDLTPEMIDVAMLLLHGGACTDPGFPEGIGENCCLGSMLGDKPTLDRFVRQRYIHVSRILGGAKANSMGQLAQQYVGEYLRAKLPSWDFSRTSIPGISQNDGHTDTSFDIVATSPSGRSCAIEVSFQVTTNSTIERKAGQALDRQRLLHERGLRIAYVIDGAGNFERRAAVSTICRHSDCTVTLRDEELTELVNFLRRLGK